MATGGGGSGGAFWRDDEIVVDRDGIPHYTGVQPGLMKEYRRRVLFAYNNLEGSGDDEEKERRSLAKKKARFGLRLIHGLHGPAWKECEELVLAPDKLKEADGYKHIFAALQGIEKVGVIKRTEAFENYFDNCHRRRGQTVDSFLRQRRQAWADLEDVAEGVKMSDDLQAYFLLRHVNLSKEDRRQILLANQSSYSVEGIEHALRVSCYDIHERERQNSSSWTSRRPKDNGKTGYAHATEADSEETMDDGYANKSLHEEAPDSPDYTDDGYHEETEVNDSYADLAQEEMCENPSDQGASEDDDIYKAYSSYQESRKCRKRLREIQRNRGFKPR